MKTKKNKKTCCKKEEKPSKYLLSSIKEVEEEIKNHDLYSFKNNKEAIKFLDKIK